MQGLEVLQLRHETKTAQFKRTSCPYQIFSLRLQELQLALNITTILCGGRFGAMVHQREGSALRGRLPRPVTLREAYQVPRLQEPPRQPFQGSDLQGRNEPSHQPSQVPGRRDEVHRTSKEEGNRKKPVFDHEKLDELRLAAFVERLESVGKWEKWNDPSRDRRVVYHPIRSRPKARSYPADQDQVGVTIELGEFADVQTLTVSEAALILSAIHASRKKHGISMVYTNGVAQ